MPQLVMTSRWRPAVVLAVMLASAWLGSTRPLQGADPDPVPHHAPTLIWPDRATG